MVDGFVRSRSRRQLVVVGSAPYADEYSGRVHALAGSDPRVRFLGGVWDQILLDQLYAHAFTYLHGHSVGGTNPSLLRAIGVGTPCTAYDVSFNREVLEDEGVYVGDRIAVTAAIEAAEADPVGTAARGARLRERAKHYDWDEVADAYENLAWALAARQTPGPHRGGRRHHIRHLPDCGGAVIGTAGEARVSPTYRETLQRLRGAQKGAARSAPAYSRFVNRRLGRHLAASPTSGG